MSKQISFDPMKLREKDTIKIPSVPVNHYVPDFKKELKTYGKERLVKVFYGPGGFYLRFSQKSWGNPFQVPFCDSKDG
jgi:hypothetical protein